MADPKNLRWAEARHEGNVLSNCVGGAPQNITLSSGAFHGGSKGFEVGRSSPRRKFAFILCGGVLSEKHKKGVHKSCLVLSLMWLLLSATLMVEDEIGILILHNACATGAGFILSACQMSLPLILRWARSLANWTIRQLDLH